MVNAPIVFSLIAVVVTMIVGTAAMSSSVVTADAQPTSWCSKPVGQSEGVVGACGFDSREDCRAFTDASSAHDVCVPNRR